jgi:hypothetical protein
MQCSNTDMGWRISDARSATQERTFLRTAALRGGSPTVDILPSIDVEHQTSNCTGPIQEFKRTSLEKAQGGPAVIQFTSWTPRRMLVLA